ncbi:MAG: hypothetical protein U7123_16240 [Potamolinea sp.]
MGSNVIERAIALGVKFVAVRTKVYVQLKQTYKIEQVAPSTLILFNH